MFEYQLDTIEYDSAETNELVARHVKMTHQNGK